MSIFLKQDDKKIIDENRFLKQELNGIF